MPVNLGESRLCARPACGVSIIGGRARYCSPACKQADYRARRAAGEVRDAKARGIEKAAKLDAEAARIEAEAKAILQSAKQRRAAAQAIRSAVSGQLQLPGTGRRRA